MSRFARGLLCSSRIQGFIFARASCVSIHKKQLRWQSNFSILAVLLTANRLRKTKNFMKVVSCDS